MGKKNYRYVIVVAAVFMLLAAALYLRNKTESVTYTKTQMGTLVQVTLMEGDRKNFENASEAAFAEIARLEKVFSSYKADSDISKINSSAGKGLLNVSPEMLEVLKKAVHVSEITGGAFDPTVGVMKKVWGLSGEKGEVPAKADVERLLPYINYRDIIIDEAAGKAGIKRAGVSINLGGVAKGYIVDKAVSRLKENGVARGIIHAGGDMVVFQTGEKSRPFTIGIQHPREKKLLGEAYVDNGAVSTSGDYERFFIKDGVRYHHILDPKTGFPAKGTQSVTLISKDPTTADALSTGIFVMGPEPGMALIEKLPDVEGVIVDANGKVRVSSGFKGKIY